MEIIRTWRLAPREQSKLGHSKCIFEIAGEQPKGKALAAGSFFGRASAY